MSSSPPVHPPCAQALDGSFIIDSKMRPSSPYINLVMALPLTPAVALLTLTLVLTLTLTLIPGPSPDPDAGW